MRLQNYNFFLKNTNYFVKKHLVYWVLLSSVLFSGRMSAEVSHYVGAFGNVGEWSLLPGGKTTSSMSLGALGGLGAVYELQAGPTYSPTRFLFDVGVGVSYGLTAFGQKGAPIDTFITGKDYQNDDFQYHYNISDRRDKYNDLAVQVPIMVGVQHKAFYMLAGIKAYYHPMMRAVTTATINTYGFYEQYYSLGITTDIPEWQFFSNVPFNQGKEAQKVNAGFIKNWDVDLSLEIGGRFGYITNDAGYDVPKSKIQYRLAGFIDCGIFDIRVDKNKTALDGIPSTYDQSYNNEQPVNATMIKDLKMNDIISTSGYADIVRNLVVGLKFTVLFEMPKAGQCVLCRDNYLLTAKKSRGGFGMQYEE